MRYEGELSTTEESRRSHLSDAEAPGPAVQELERERSVSSSVTPSGIGYLLVITLCVQSSDSYL